MVAAPMDTFEAPLMVEDSDRDPAMPGTAMQLRRGRPAAFAPARRPFRAPAPVRAPAPAFALPTPGGRIADAIEAALFPRLVMLLGDRSAAVPQRVDATLASLIDPFAACLIADDEAASANALLRQLHGRGTSLETICLEVMAPAARRLGILWETDDCDFALVTLGLNRLHRLMHELDARPSAIAAPVDPDRVALLAVAQGEQHIFGVAMVGDFLRRAGWEIHDAVGAQCAEITEIVRRMRISVVALSCSTQGGLPGLAGRIAAIREASRNRDIAILVGGLAFEHAPEAAIRVGADAMAHDARAAVFQAERLLAIRQGAMAEV